MPVALPVPTLDHVVVNVRDEVEAGLDTYRRLGFTMTPRGYHSLGSMNHLAILGTEFQWAQRVLHWTRDRYDTWTAWLRRQRPVVRLAVIAGTGLLVVVTLWLVNVFGLVAGWVGVQWDWVRSPLA